jgi:transposase
MGPKGNAQQLQHRRLRAMKLLKKGRRPADVAREVGVSPGALSQWQKRFAVGGRKALLAKRHSGPAPKITAAQQKRLVWLLRHPPSWPGFRWTLTRVQKLIQREIGVTFQRSSVWYLLDRLGWTCQRPATQQQIHADACPKMPKKQVGKMPALFAATPKLPPLLTRSTWAPRRKLHD